jgi:hypothetical protein
MQIPLLHIHDSLYNVPKADEENLEQFQLERLSLKPSESKI